MFLSRVKFSEVPRNIGVAHTQVWSLFPDKGGERPFVFAHQGDGIFLIYSRIQPVSDTATIECKAFLPTFEAGQHLRFQSVLSPCANRGKQRKTVFALAREDGDERGVDDIVLEWGETKLEASGFSADQLSLVELDLGPYTRTQGRSYPLAKFEGIGRVDAPEVFLAAIGKGIGRGGAYGAGGLFVAPAARR